MIEILIAATPLLLLLGSLLLGIYPGCDAIVRLSERIASVGNRLTMASDSPRPAPPASHAAHGGLLLAFGLSGRAPPA